MYLSGRFHFVWTFYRKDPAITSRHCYGKWAKAGIRTPSQLRIEIVTKGQHRRSTYGIFTACWVQYLSKTSILWNTFYWLFSSRRKQSLNIWGKVLFSNLNQNYIMLSDNSEWVEAETRMIKCKDESIGRYSHCHKPSIDQALRPGYRQYIERWLFFHWRY